MIELVSERLPPASEQKLRKWLSQPEANTLRRVVEARGQVLQAEASNRAVRAAPGSQTDLLQQDGIKEAARYDSFIRIFSELIEQPKETPFELAKQKTTSYADTIIPSDGPEEA